MAANNVLPLRTKWYKLHHGPLWCVTLASQAPLEPRHSSDSKRIQEALVNVPGLSERTLRRDIESSSVTLTSEIQMSVLLKLTQTHGGGLKLMVVILCQE